MQGALIAFLITMHSVSILLFDLPILHFSLPFILLLYFPPSSKAIGAVGGNPWSEYQS